METRFYVGQRVRVTQNGLTYSTHREAFEQFGFKDKKSNPVFDDGTEATVFAVGIVNDHALCVGIRDLHGNESLIQGEGVMPITPPRVVLTEWQKKQIARPIQNVYKDGERHASWSISSVINEIESILSQPEPPKYQPKQGEAVIFRDRKDCPWSASVATGICWRIYYYGDTLDAFEVRPFDPAMVGQVTND